MDATPTPALDLLPHESPEELERAIAAARRIVAATPVYQAADAAWIASLTRAFGKSARDRRYDSDQTGHPAECHALFQARSAAQDEFHAAWQAWLGTSLDLRDLACAHVRAEAVA